MHDMQWSALAYGHDHDMNGLLEANLMHGVQIHAACCIYALLRCFREAYHVCRAGYFLLEVLLSGQQLRSGHIHDGCTQVQQQ